MEGLEGAGAESNEVDVDGILADVDAGREVGSTPAPEEAQPPAEQAWKGEEWEFDWNGKKIVPETRDKLKIWAQQGYNYSQRMGELNKTHAQRMQEAEAKAAAAAEAEARFKPYAEVDQYAQENKDWWEHVQQSFKTRATHGVDPAFANVLNPLQEKIGQLEQFMTAQQQEAEKARVAAEAERQAAEHEKQDQALDAEIESIRKQYPTIDLSARDESGETLERRVYKHGAEIGTTSFRAAFRDLLFDQLTVQQQAQQKLQAVRGTQAQVKAGTLGRTPAPTKELKPIDTKRPWNDPQFDVENILAELRLQGG